MRRASDAPSRGCITSTLDWAQFRRPFPDCFFPMTSRWHLIRTLLGLPMTFFFVRLGYLTLGGSPTAWLASKVVLASPGFVVMHLNSCTSALGFLVSLCSASAGLCLGLSSLGLEGGATFELTLLHSMQYLLGSLIMRLLVDTRCTVDNVKSLRFFLVMVVMSVLTPSIGASFNVFFFPSDTRESDGLGMAWIEWFVPNVAAMLVTLSLGSVILAYCIRRGALKDFQKLLRTRLGLLYTVVVFGCVGIIGVVYSLEDLHATKAIPLMLMVMPVLGSLSLVMPQFATAWIDVGLVFAMAYGTRYDRGPLHALLKGSDQLGTTLCVQASLLLSVALTATLRVARQQRTSAFKLQRIDSERKLAFFTHVSHEFRTPLSVVIGYTEDLLEHRQLSPSVRVDMENILYASLGMSAMVEDLLALFRLETHGLVFSSRPIQTRLFFDKVLVVAERLARTKRHQISIHVDLPQILVFDPNRMNQMVVNLLSNAVKFTPSGGRIKIDARLASQSENIGNGGSSSGSSIGDIRDCGLGGSHGSHAEVKDANMTSTPGLSCDGTHRDPGNDALHDSRTGGEDKRTMMDNDRCSDVSSKRPSLDTGHKIAHSDHTDGSGNDPRSYKASKRPSFNTIHKKYFNLTNSNAGNPSKSRRPSFSAVHNGNFGIHNNFTNGLVVDLDGSNGLLALLGRRRGVRVPRSRGTSSSGRDFVPTSRGASPPPPPRPPPTPPPPPRNAGAGSTPFPVDAAKSSPLMVISVTDSGPGIPPADVSRLFERFFRADTTGVEGTGLGLTICQHIATSLGGQIKVCSTVGVGSTFAVTIPVVEIPCPTPPTVALAMAPATAPSAIGGQSTDTCGPQPRARPGMVSERSDVSLSALVEWTKHEDAEEGNDDTQEEQKEGEEEENRGCAMNGKWRNIERPGTGNEEGRGMRVGCGASGSGEEVDYDAFGHGDLEARVLESLEEGRRGEGEHISCPKYSRGPSKETEEGEGRESARGRTKGRELEAEEWREGTAVTTPALCLSRGTPVAAAKATAVSTPEVRPPGRMAAAENVHEDGIYISGTGSQSKDGAPKCGAHVDIVSDGGGGGNGGEKPFQLKILLAEDSLPNQKLMCRILQRAGHTVEAVGDGQAALDRLVSGDFDMLVLDLGLPKKEGMEVLAELRSMPHTMGAIRDIPVIVSSGHVLDETRRLCLEAGCNAFTEKPFRAKVIVETVQRVMMEHVSGANIDCRRQSLDSSSLKALD